MNIIRFLVNPDSNNPTAGLRGLFALAIGLSASAWLDWQTSGIPLAVVFFGGILVGLQLLSEAQHQIETVD